MIGVSIQKQRIEHFLKAIKTGGSIQPQAGEWTAFEMLALAGAMHFGVMSHGPQQYAGQLEKLQSLHDEQREATEEGWFDDLRNAIEFCSQLAMLIRDGEYDAQFPAEFLAALNQTDGGKVSVKIYE